MVVSSGYDKSKGKGCQALIDVQSALPPGISVQGRHLDR